MACQQQYYSDFTVKWATLDWEISAAKQLRQRIFCQEQGLFEGTDADDVDAQAQLLVASANHGGWHERVVGTVRIHQASAGVWWGSRLAIASDLRGQSRLAAALIKLAVSSAHALGCEQFYATVQARNERLFQRLHWRREHTLELAGAPHVLMQADLEYYPPCLQPRSGYVLTNRAPAIPADIMPLLLRQPPANCQAGAAHAA
ncbi:GNAT family N-acetyltransferase [Pseudomaricurvus alcaniphilus]|uniref:MSMEG_0567/Sll0786 family nitrogen starvation N-acetyltransferase n=1 Tax=Pseudomaricurvus alcaniphilus TaxID=1166482 RepID=UPI00140ADAA9|nr:MSMEG_0567/Sll0786 family nitrogen starvation N-acetyltransferase [Pseudomaricurvus alcaniphilus]NHN39497.1 GNAT family N-acetyltransferase [Pseudomaricurvus alcaniphilus]